jgi:hypothetical protein
MGQCTICGSETDLHVKRVPICPECDRSRANPMNPPACPDRRSLADDIVTAVGAIRAAMVVSDHEALAAARLAENEALAEFERHRHECGCTR